jgi:hypothetical protein
LDFLTVDQYDAAEQDAIETTPNRILECCQPTTFMLESYPLRIHATRAAGRYVDVMHEGRAHSTFEMLLKGLTKEELDLMQVVAAKIAALTQDLYGHRQVPRSAMLRALNIVRHIRYLYPEPTAVIFEIGSGSGYVGALLVELGYRYVSTDITQAFYIYQSHMLTRLLSGRLIELAIDTRSFLDLDGIPPGHAVHVPWWKYMATEPQISFGADIVTCNHALCEMHSNALRYTCKLAREILQKRAGLFLFEGWGSTVRHPIWHAGRALSNAGFSFAHNDVQASVLVLDGSPAAEGALKLPPRTSKVTDGEEAFHPPIYVSPSHQIGAKVLAGRKVTNQTGKYLLEDLDHLLREEAGDAALASDDERFMRFVNDDRR